MGLSASDKRILVLFRKSAICGQLNQRRNQHYLLQTRATMPQHRALCKQNLAGFVPCSTTPMLCSMSTTSRLYIHHLRAIGKLHVCPFEWPRMIHGRTQSHVQINHQHTKVDWFAQHNSCDGWAQTGTHMATLCAFNVIGDVCTIRPSSIHLRYPDVVHQHRPLHTMCEGERVPLHPFHRINDFPEWEPIQFSTFRVSVVVAQSPQYDLHSCRRWAADGKYFVKIKSLLFFFFYVVVAAALVNSF